LALLLCCFALDSRYVLGGNSYDYRYFRDFGVEFHWRFPPLYLGSFSEFDLFGLTNLTILPYQKNKK
jgi:hypothetical protein